MSMVIKQNETRNISHEGDEVNKIKIKEFPRNNQKILRAEDLEDIFWISKNKKFKSESINIIWNPDRKYEMIQNTVDEFIGFKSRKVNYIHKNKLAPLILGTTISIQHSTKIKELMPDKITPIMK